MTRIISVSAKCSDMCFVQFPDGTESEGYVPHGIGIGGGDYIEMKIDADTGQILDWPQPTTQESESD